MTESESGGQIAKPRKRRRGGGTDSEIELDPRGVDRPSGRYRRGRIVKDKNGVRYRDC